MNEHGEKQERPEVEEQGKRIPREDSDEKAPEVEEQGYRGFRKEGDEDDPEVEEQGAGDRSARPDKRVSTSSYRPAFGDTELVMCRPGRGGPGIGGSRNHGGVEMRRLVFAVAVVISAWLVPAASAEEIPGRYIVVLEGSVDRPGQVAAAHERQYGADSEVVYRHALNGYVAAVPEATLAELRADPKVQFVARDRVFAQLPKAPATIPSCKDPGDISAEQCLPDGANRIDAERSSARSGDGRGRERANIAIIDTGLDIDHPDLNVVGGVDCSDGTPIFDRARYDDFDGHGTFIGGVAGAKDNGFGVVGVAPGASLWAARVQDDAGVISDAALICALDWVTSTRTDRNLRNDISVANMSITGAGSDDQNCGRTNADALHLAYCRSVAAGVTHVVSAGNDGVDVTHETPNSYNEVLTAT